MKKEICKTYDTETVFKLAKVARRYNHKFSSILYRTPAGLFLEQEEYGYGPDGYETIVGRFILPVTAEEALERLGSNADMPIKIHPTKRMPF
jgi:hypothetical protein